MLGRVRAANRLAMDPTSNGAATNAALKEVVLSGVVCPECNGKLTCNAGLANCLTCIRSGKVVTYRLPTARVFEGLQWRSAKVWDQVFVVEDRKGLWGSPKSGSGELLAWFEFVPQRTAVVKLTRCNGVLEGKLRELVE